MRLFHAARARARLLLGRRAAEARMNDEMRFHVEMEASRLAREEGLDPVEARRRAVLAFGYAETYKDEMRAGRGRLWPTGLSLDLKLGFRMLVKYPGLTLVGGLAMAFGIWAGTMSFVMVGQALYPSLPLPGGDRVVRIHAWHALESREESRLLHDFATWREGLRSVTDLGAWRDVQRNVAAGTEAGRPVRIAEITSTAFRIAPESPLLGRVLAPADERAEAPPVIVLGHELWKSRFAGDAGMVGRTVRLGDGYATVVGVMREGFGFPVSHEAWVPLRQDAMTVAGPVDGPAISVFGRLAPGATLAQAQAELATLGRRAAAARPDRYEHLEMRVADYVAPAGPPKPGDTALMFSIQLFGVMLLVLICANVALLLFARAASRESELVVRSALGASRGRIVAQLFAEALVLGGVAAGVGLLAADLSLQHWGIEFLERNIGPLPFWYDLSISPTTVLYAGMLTVLGAAVAGVLPGRKITRGLSGRLRQGTGGGGGPRFGGVWTAVIVLQVALTVAFPVVVFVVRGEHTRIRTQDVGIATDEYLGVKLEMDAGTDTAASRARFGSALEALRRRVAAEPGVTGVTFVDRLPQDYHRERWVELDDATGTRAVQPADPEVSLAAIDPTYFEVMQAPVLAGRAFTAADMTPGAQVAIVDQGFVDKMLRGRRAVGQRLRFSSRGQFADDDARPWYTIVGVVPELGMTHAAHNHRPAGVYLPAAPESYSPTHLVVHAQGDPLALAGRVRELAVAVDPTVRLTALNRLDQNANDMLWILRLWLRVTLVLTAVALLLSLAGIYAVLSFTVSRRTREIGVRIALGAPRRQLVLDVFRRPLTQVTIGIVSGFVLVATAANLIIGHQPDGQPSTGEGLTLVQGAMLLAHAATMFAVCMLACIVPTRRALRVQPTEALRAD